MAGSILELAEFFTRLPLYVFHHVTGAIELADGLSVCLAPTVSTGQNGDRET